MLERSEIREFAEKVLKETPPHLKIEMIVFLKKLIRYLEANPNSSPQDGERDRGEIPCSVELEEYLHTIGFPSLTH